MKNILEVRHVSAAYTDEKQGRQVLKDISLEVKENEILGLVGESGCGKSTTVKMLTHLLKPDSGEILLEGTEIQHLKGKALKKLYTEIQMVFQIPQDSFDPRRTLGDSIMESIMSAERKHRIGCGSCYSRWNFLQSLQTVIQIRSAADSVSAQQLPEHWQLIRKS